MKSSLLSIHLISGPVPVVVQVLAVVALLGLLWSRRWRRWLPIAGAVMFGGVLLGLLTCWLLGDVLDLFGVDLSFVTRAWFAAGVAGIALAIARIVFSGRRWIAPGLASAVVLALVGSLGINADLGEFPTLSSALGVRSYSPLVVPESLTATASMTTTVAHWSAPADLPAHGRLGSVVIPATTSHFSARAALVYLPPAALVANPPRLPVLVMLSGQPGQPSDLFVSGRLASILDAQAAAHHGLAPIVVVPDQLGAAGRNPMCVDSALGNSATYVLVDVQAWIRTHLAVLAGPAHTGIGGFSQGGTCAIQFGSADPDLYGTIVDISGEVAPKSGSVQQTIARGFAGSRAAYERAVPANILAAGAGYPSTFAVFAIGADDLRYGAGLRSVASAATSAGMTTTLLQSPGTAHDWHTVVYALSKAIPLVSAHWGLDG